MRALAPALAILVACSTLAACDSDNDDPPVYEQPPPQLGPDTGQSPVNGDIATGQTIDSDPGTGAGVFVEYAGAGEWHLWTTCDTPTSGEACEYTLFARANSSVRFESFDGPVGAYDGAGPYAPGVLEADFETTNEIDGLRFHADPGATVTITAWLDGVAEPRAIYWYGLATDGSDAPVLHPGAPSDPVALTPDTP